MSLFGLDPSIFLVISVGLVVLLFSFMKIHWGVGFLIFASALSPEIMIGGIPIRIQDILIPCIFFFWMLRHISRRHELKPTNMLVPFSLFVFSMAVSTIHAFIVRPGGTDKLFASLHFARHIEFFLFFFLVFQLVKDEEDLRFFSYCGLGAAFSSVVWVLYSVLFQGVPGRLEGIPTETANIFGGFLVFYTLIAFSFFLEEKDIVRKIILATVVILFLYPLLLTYSRGSYVGLLAGLIFLGIVREPKIFIGLVFIPPLLAPFLGEGIVNRFFSIINVFTDAEMLPSWSARLEAWQHYLPQVLKYPLIGRGLRYIPMGAVDNELVLRVVETGILGLGAFLWVFIGFIRRAWMGWRESRATIQRQIHLGYLAGILGLFVHSLAATSFTTIRTAEPIYYFGGLILAGYLLILEIKPGDSAGELRTSESARSTKRKRELFNVQRIPLSPEERKDRNQNEE